MGDSETVVVQTSAAIDHPSIGYASTDYTAVNSNNVSDGGAYATDSAVDSTSSAPPIDGGYALPDGSNLGDGNAYSTDPSYSMQEAPPTSTYDATNSVVGVAAASENVVSHENSVVDSAHVTGYESMNGNGVNEMESFPLTGNGENGSVSNDASGSAVEQQFEEAPGISISSEEDRLWSIVRANCLDFNAWTALIQETEKVAEDNILKIQKVYDAFLVEFPLCYGYWKKYADHETRLSGVDKVVEVYERAVQAVTYSVDIWLHYCVFAISTYGDPDTIRRLFERGLAYVGTDYLSSSLWDKYIEYEYSQQEWSHLAMIYTRILENPIQQLERYFTSFKELAGSRPLSEIRTAEEAALVAASLDTSGQGVEGEVYPDGAERSPKPLLGGHTSM
eukprot:TRINITY_DN213_c0_g1_i7.p1 TRINITY_DN213_c0_g1~~TRINITY_DN213_c0_g1_i7.p1  ORF type:complete len:441 (+),score=89.28 TRINITY_DN213_c0_g1_i7:149-1324(+)